ncbi:MAG: hypothetical protein WAV05_15425 [Anaerolineales bacterium]
MNQIHDTYIPFSEERGLITMATFIKTTFYGTDIQARIRQVQTLSPFLW